MIAKKVFLIITCFYVKIFINYLINDFISINEMVNTLIDNAKFSFHITYYTIIFHIFYLISIQLHLLY
jgi:hypothetical protein